MSDKYHLLKRSLVYIISILKRLNTFHILYHSLCTCPMQFSTDFQSIRCIILSELVQNLVCIRYNKFYLSISRTEDNLIDIARMCYRGGSCLMDRQFARN
jgi:hypothetical protein